MEINNFTFLLTKEYRYFFSIFDLIISKCLLCSDHMPKRPYIENMLSNYCVCWHMCGHLWADAYAVTQYLWSGLNSVCQQKFVMGLLFCFFELQLENKFGFFLQHVTYSWCLNSSIFQRIENWRTLTNGSFQPRLVSVC